MVIVRKRLIIGAVAVVVIGVAAYLVSQPKEGTVEWHKREYRRACERLYRNTLIDKVRAICGRVIRIGPRSTEKEPEIIRHHEQALIKARYFSERKFALTNDATDVMARLGMLLIKASTNLTGYPSVQWASISSIRVVGPAKDIPLWEEMVRQADVTESK